MDDVLRIPKPREDCITAVGLVWCGVTALPRKAVAWLTASLMVQHAEWGEFVVPDFLYCRFKISSLCAADKPGKPGEPECEGTTEDSITLSWEPPLKDGGKPIKGYVVEKREKGSKRWTKYVSALYFYFQSRMCPLILL